MWQSQSQSPCVSFTTDGLYHQKFRISVKVWRFILFLTSERTIPVSGIDWFSLVSVGINIGWYPFRYFNDATRPSKPVTQCQSEVRVTHPIQMIDLWVGLASISHWSPGRRHDHSRSQNRLIAISFEYVVHSALFEVHVIGLMKRPSCEMTRDWAAMERGIIEGVWSDSLHASLGGRLCFMHRARPHAECTWYVEWAKWNEIRLGRGTAWTVSEEGWRLGSDMTTHVLLC